jgi:hypothetical protein
MYVLIILWMTSMGNTNFASTSVEFTSYGSCENARAELKSKEPSYARFHGWCVPR